MSEVPLYPPQTSEVGVDVNAPPAPGEFESVAGLATDTTVKPAGGSA